MSMTFLKISAVTSGLFFSAMTAEAAVHFYEIEGHWSDQSECDHVAEEVSRALHNRVSVVSSGCEKTNMGFKTRVAYAAPDKLNIVSTVSPYARVPSYQGGYKSKEECLANADRELEIFRAKTGLVPFLNLCFNETGSPASYLQYDWNLRLDAFGPVVPGGAMPQEMAVNMVGYFLTSPEFIRQSLNSALVARDLTPSMVAAHHSSSIGNLLKFRAYSASEIEFGQTQIANFVDATSCLAEADRLNKSLFSSDRIYLTAFCMSDRPIITENAPRPLNTNLRLAHLSYNIWSTNRPQKLPGAFATYGECDAQRPAVIERIESANGIPVRASLCGKGAGPGEDQDQRFFIFIFE